MLIRWTTNQRFCDCQSSQQCFDGSTAMWLCSASSNRWPPMRNPRQWAHHGYFSSFSLCPWLSASARMSRTEFVCAPKPSLKIRSSPLSSNSSLPYQSFPLLLSLAAFSCYFAEQFVRVQQFSEQHVLLVHVSYWLSADLWPMTDELLYWLITYLV